MSSETTQPTNFAIETISQPIDGLCFGTKSTITINKIGDQINNMYLGVKIPELSVVGGHAAWVNTLGHKIIKNVELSINTNIELKKKYDIIFDDVWEDMQYAMRDPYNKMIGNVPQLTSLNCETKSSYTIFVPLSFKSNENNVSAFPINLDNCAQISITIELQDIEKLLVKTADACIPDLKITDASIISTYMFTKSYKSTKLCV